MKQKPRFLESFINSPLISESICSLSSALCWPTQISQAVPVTHASVPAVALSLFSPFPGPFMGFRWPYLYFFSCLNMLIQLGSSNVITWKFPCLCLLIASLSSLLIHLSKCLGFLLTPVKLIFRNQRVGLSSLATVCVVPLNFWVAADCLGYNWGGIR